MSDTYKLPEHEQHEIAIHLMPGGMDDMEFNAFCVDVGQRGFVGGPITLYEGKVLDGWHRYRAAKKTGTAPTFKEYTGNDPAGYVAASNVLRRKLGSLQKALVAARLHRDHGTSQREACSRMSTSNEVLNLVLKALDSKSTKLIKRIESDSEFTRGMLKEELADAGLYRTSKPEEPTPTGPNSVFNQVPDTDGIGEEEDEAGEVDKLLGEPGTGTGLTKDKNKRTRASKTEAQKLAEEYQALGEADKISFLTIIWPTAGKLVDKHKIPQAVGRMPPPEDPSVKAWKAIEAKAAKAKEKKTTAKKAVKK